ncbi:MAG: cupin domain-containing protein [Rhodobacteraceae bacterium]|nr:cupin domain-containing protein [Paracoccaceae bacterium]
MENSDDLATGTVQIDNHRVRVTEWRFAPGQATGHHRHEFDYVVVPLNTGELRIVDVSGEEVISKLQKGHTYFRGAGVEHNVFNANDTEFAFVEIELKS